MKKIFLFALSLYNMTVMAQTNYPTGINSCIARWNFTSSSIPITSLTDVSGNNNHGLTFNLSTSNGFRNAVSKAMKFNGSNSYAEVLHNTLLQPDSITMLALVKLDTFYTKTCQNTSIISKGTSSSSSGMYSLDINDNIWDNNNCFSYSPNHMQLGASLGGAFYLPNAGNYINLHHWYLLVVTYNANTVTYYQIQMDTSNYQSTINPIYISGNLQHPIGNNLSNVMIGKMNNSLYPYWLNGSLDELALFNKRLNTSEIHDIYDYLWGKVVINKPFIDTLICSGSSFNLPYSVSDNFPSTFNVFTVELSDQNGNFINPVIIGSHTSNTSGSINCFIPPNLAPGNGYRIRIAPSIPVLISRDNGVNIHIVPPIKPIVQISASPSNIITGQPITFTAFVSNTSSPLSYQWKKNGSTIPTATNSSYTSNTLSNNDIISVMVYSTQSCIDSSESNTITLITTSSTNFINTSYNWQIFPNPSNGIINVKGKSERNTMIDFELLNSLGQIVARKSFQCEDENLNQQIFHLKNINNGTYFLQISTKKEMTIIPILFAP